MISVIICTYNYGHYLDRCLPSIINQSINDDNFEIIVVDDGSEDATRKILQNYASHIKILTHQKNLNSGDYLIDDRTARGTDLFAGEHIHFGTENFPDWNSVMQYLRSKEQF